EHCGQKQIRCAGDFWRGLTPTVCAKRYTATDFCPASSSRLQRRQYKLSKLLVPDFRWRRGIFVSHFAAGDGASPVSTLKPATPQTLLLHATKVQLLSLRRCCRRKYVDGFRQGRTATPTWNQALL